VSKPLICDRCDVRIDTAWNGAALTVKNTTGTGGPNTIHLCVDCHTAVRDDLYPLLLDGGNPYEHPENL